MLQQLYAQGFLTHSQYVNSLVYPMPDPSKVNLPSTQNVTAPYFANYVKDRLVKHFGPRRTFGGGLRVRTTLDVNLQKLARKAIASVLPAAFGPTAALVVLDAQTGDVLAMVGGANYHKSQFNLATQGERQPGSSFKPFVLATALKEGIAPSSILTSSKHVTINADGRLWQVNNYEGEALGPINLSQAIAYSDNSVFSQLTALVGPRSVRDTAKELGITTPLQGYFAIGLGRRAGHTARDGAGLPELRRRRRSNRRLDLRQRAARRAGREGQRHDTGEQGGRPARARQCRAEP